MPENLFSQKNIIIEIIILAAVLGGGYYGYSTLFSEDQPTTVSLNPSLLNKDVVAFIGAKSKIDLKDTKFINSTYYKQLVDYSETIPRTTERSRLNPFIPYAATGPSR
jgi:hypothetical protein